ncbi:MAG TPA: hypothetical protein VNO50_07130 [Pyrinomonadaceae bacterium]|nr:hypothetical protein [Pyrinomonadaceae bacterium]
MAGKLKPLLSVAISFAFLVSLSYLSNTLGQSGRRAPKSKTVNAPIPEPDPTPSPARQTSQPTLKFILGMNHDSFTSVSISGLSGIKRNIARRMGERTWVRVTMTPGPMARSEAIKLAKAEKESYVVWVQVREDAMSARQPNSVNTAFIEYVVFAPETAKVMTSGATYPGGRNMVILERRTPEIDGDRYLNQAARETADKILSKFNLIAPRKFL